MDWCRYASQKEKNVKNHSELKAKAAKNPNAEDIYAPSLIDNFYPTRPSELENVCLYDFVAHYMMGMIKMVNESTEN